MSPLASHWDLDPAWNFLNHGSFGAAPRVVLEEQRRIQERMERQPVRFFAEWLEPALDKARSDVAAFVGCDADDLAFISNATQGVSTIVKSLVFAPGDELLVTDHAYNACWNALRSVAARTGARIVIAHVPFPIASADQVVDAVLAAATDRTKLALIDHVTSPTGLVFPVDRLVPALQSRGIDVLVDGAHAPGMVPLAIDRLGAAYYTGNLHKWLCTPKGSAILHVRRDRQDRIEPLSISHGFNANRSDRSRFRLNFDFGGTDDPSAVLCAKTAIDFLGGLLPGGWDELRARNHALALQSRDLLCAALKIEKPAPDDMLGSLAAAPLPVGTDVDALSKALVAARIEVPILMLAGAKFRPIRTASQLYNDLAQTERLAGFLEDFLRSGGSRA